jgi:hypothetical protein
MVITLIRNLKQAAIILGGILMCSLPGLVPDLAYASTYRSNFENIPAVNKRPIRVAVWRVTPTVIICEHAPIDEDTATKAVKFWEGLGHRFFRTQYKYDPLGKCNNSQPLGYIIVRLVTQEIKLDSGALAETHFFIDNDTRAVEWATIYMRSDVRETVLEHEIGHALGYLHYNKINHLMNSKWIQGGWDVDGLKN